jgi:hypothetical protein
MTGLTLDAGALIAIERRDHKMLVLLDTAERANAPIAIPAGALGQVWRDGRTQVRLARFLALDWIEVVVLDDTRARQAGQLCGARGTSDVVDASVVLCARERGDHIVTSDRTDLERLDPTADIIEI